MGACSHRCVFPDMFVLVLQIDVGLHFCPQMVINVFAVPDAAGLICVTLGQLEIREVRSVNAAHPGEASFGDWFYLQKRCPCEQDTLVLQPLTSVPLRRFGPDCHGCVQIQSGDLVPFSIRLCPAGVYTLRQRKVTHRPAVAFSSPTSRLHHSTISLSLSLSSHQHVKLPASGVSWRLC